jgi:ABC-type multidrug transport system ATPase subunit
LAEPEFRLRAEGIGKSYGATEVLKSAAVWARAGEVTTLMGRNGSGKTTLMRIAVGDLPGDQGTVSLAGVTYERPRLARLARAGLMYVPQDELVVPHYRVRHHFAALRAVFPDARVDETVEETRIGGLLDHPVEALSGGERMRVSLALALARRPEVLVVDEPLVGLAPQDQQAMAGMLRDLARTGSAVVTSGHDARVLLEVSDVVIWSVAGTTHHLGTPDEARRHEQFCREYLGPRYR